MLVLSTSGQVEAGGTVAVTLQNRSAAALAGELEYDANLLQALQPAAGQPGRLSFTLVAAGEQVFMLRVLDAAAGQNTEVSVVGTSATAADGTAPTVQVQGDGSITVLGK